VESLIIRKFEFLQHASPEISAPSEAERGWNALV